MTIPVGARGSGVSWLPCSYAARSPHLPSPLRHVDVGSESDEAEAGGYGARANKKKRKAHVAPVAPPAASSALKPALKQSTPAAAAAVGPAGSPTSSSAGAAGTQGSAASRPAPPPPLNLMKGFALPRGAPGCLADTVFVMTGDLAHLRRDVVERLITSHGGRHTCEGGGGGRRRRRRMGADPVRASSRAQPPCLARRRTC